MSEVHNSTDLNLPLFQVCASCRENYVDLKLIEDLIINY